MANEPVQATIELDFQGRGQDSISAFHESIKQHWNTIEGSVNRVGNAIDGIGRSIGSLAGIAGVGAVVNDFMRLEAAANQAAIAIGNVTGTPAQFQGMGSTLQGLGARYGIDPTQTASGIVAGAALAGGRYSPASAGRFGQFLDLYSRGTGIDVTNIGQFVGQLAQAQHQRIPGGVGSLAQVTAILGGQFTGQALQAALSGVAGVTSSTAAAFPFQTGGISAGISGMYSAAAGANSVYRNPSVFSAGISSINSGLSGAYTNPSAQAFLQMAGVSYMDQRKGLRDPVVAQKILAQADRMYGTGPIGSQAWTNRDMALRSLFGDDGANLLEQLGSGGTINRASSLAQTTPGQGFDYLSGPISQAAAGSLLTPDARLGQLRYGIGSQARGPLQALSQMSLLQLLGIGVGAKVGTSLLGTGGRMLLGRLGVSGAAAGADGAEGAVAAASLGELGLLGSVAGAVLPPLGIAAIGASIIDPGGPEDILGKLTGGGLAVPDFSARSRDAVVGNAVNSLIGAAKKKFGGEWTSKRAQAWMHRQLYDPSSHYSSLTRIHSGGDLSSPHPWAAQQELDRLTQQYHQDARDFQTLGPQGFATLKFSRAVDDFAKAVQGMNSPGSKNAAYMGPTGGGASPVSLGAPAISAIGATSVGMEMAAFATGGGSSGGGGGAVSQFASFLSAGPAPAGGASTSDTTGSGWRDGVASWYDPGQGGMNGSYGAGAWSGHPIKPGMWGVAHKSLPFGTQVTIAYGGSQVTVPVVDRGPFVAGRDFDLLPAPAKALGMTSAGVVRVKWKVASAGGSSGASRSGSSGSAGSAGGGSGGGRPQVSAASVGGSRSAGGVGGGPGGNVHVHVHVDGREIQRQRVLTRGSA